MRKLNVVLQFTGSGNGAVSTNLVNKAFTKFPVKNFNFTVAMNKLKWYCTNPTFENLDYTNAKELLEFYTKSCIQSRAHCISWEAEEVFKALHKEAEIETCISMWESEYIQLDGHQIDSIDGPCSKSKIVMHWVQAAQHVVESFNSKQENQLGTRTLQVMIAHVWHTYDWNFNAGNKISPSYATVDNNNEVLNNLSDEIKYENDSNQVYDPGIGLCQFSSNSQGTMNKLCGPCLVQRFLIQYVDADLILLQQTLRTRFPKGGILL